MDKIGKILCASAPEDKFDRHRGQRTGLRLPWNGKIREKEGLLPGKRCRCRILPAVRFDSGWKNTI